MFELGISAYWGIGEQLNETLSYLKLARHYGYSRLFTSLQIPEANAALDDLQKFTVSAAELGYQVTADISAKTLQQFGATATDLKPLAKLGLTTLRLDDGFSAEQIATLTRCGDWQIELNASTITDDVLTTLKQSKAKFNRLCACHNYYPRPETGLSFSLFASRCELLHSYGIPVFAFIPSHTTPRAPLFAGLPTLEKHRSLPAVLAAKELMATHLVDGLLFGDPLTSETELAAVAALDPNSLELTVTLRPNLSPEERKILFSAHTNRDDPGEHVARSREARKICKATIPLRTPPEPRLIGAVTIDNEAYLRYWGELQVVLAPLPPDPRVNVVAQINDEEQFLLSYLTPGAAFHFKEALHES